MVSKEFFKQLEIISEERGIELEKIIEAVKEGLTKACKKANGGMQIRVELKPEKHEILIYSQQLVVSDITSQEEDAMPQILLADAKKINSKIKEGDVLEQLVNPKDFGRIAASTGKQVFNNALRNVEKDKKYNHFKSMENEMINADVVQISADFITLNIGYETTTLLPIREKLPNDDFQVGDRVKVYISAVESTAKGPKIFVSRSDKNLVTRLMETIIPEIKDGIIEIKGIARDAGDRTKIAIYSNDPHVDSIGSCVGEGGARIREVVNALNGEKIDLYRYSDDPIELIKNSLQPAQVIGVVNLDPKMKTSLAIVPDDQLSLAIGKAGQNVRLAVQSCGWKIDIKSASDAKKEGIRY